VRIAYLDESGTPEATGGTTHFVLLALAIPGHTWKAKDAEIAAIKQRFGLADAVELHAGWMNRSYSDQDRIPNFASLSRTERVAAVRKVRDAMLLKRAALKGLSSLRSLKTMFRKTEPYVHLTRAERLQILRLVAEQVASWPDVCIFADCVDKRVTTRIPTFEGAFDQVVTRFHAYLDRQTPKEYGLLVQDRNDTVADRLTSLMRSFHQGGTRWTGQIPLVVETPLFVDSRLTSMVQVADVCSYALRRYLENGESVLFEPIYTRGDRYGGRCVGIRHYRGSTECRCLICTSH
jgi:hypothetical protein